MGHAVSRRPLALLLLCAAVLLPGYARAEEQAACTVRVVHGDHKSGGFDARLEPLRAHLSRPPFSAWKGFQLLAEHDLRIPAGATAAFGLPDQHEGALAFQGHVEGAKKRRLRMRLQIRDGAALLVNTEYKIDDGGTVFNVGIRHQGGMLILGLTCQLQGG